MLYVLAGSPQQARSIASDFIELPRKAYKIINDARDLQGLRGEKVMLCGTYYQRADWYALRDELLLIQARVSMFNDRPLI